MTSFVDGPLKIKEHFIFKLKGNFFIKLKSISFMRFEGIYLEIGKEKEKEVRKEIKEK